MATVFVKHNGKVFGPLTHDRVRDLIKSGSFDANAQFASAWNGPWGALAAATDTQPAPATLSPPPPAIHADASHSVNATGDTGDPLTSPVEAEAEEDIFASLPAFRPSPHRRFTPLRRTQNSLPAMIGASALGVAAVVMAVLLLPAGKDRGRQRGRTATDAIEADGGVPTGSGLQVRPRSTTTISGSGTRTMREPVQPPQSRKSQPQASDPLQSAADRRSTPQSSAQAMENDPPSNSDSPTGRYASVSADVVEAVKSLRSLRASVELGISFQLYSEKLQQLLPPVMLFLESHDADSLPEMKTLLSNAVDCYAKVKSLWNDSLFADSPAAKSRATELFERARERLWKVAAANVLAAHELTNTDATVRASVISRLTTDCDALRMEPILASVMLDVEQERATLASHVSGAATEPDRPRRPSVPRARPFDRNRIDIQGMRAAAESMDLTTLAEQESELVASFLRLTRNREWAAKDGDKKWGEPLMIQQEWFRVDFKKDGGIQFIRRELLSPASQQIVTRIEELAEHVHNLRQSKTSAGDQPR